MILLYHHVAPNCNGSAQSPAANERQFTISPERLQQRLRMFAERRYKFVLLGEIVRRILEAGKEPDDVVAVTFDDGWLDNYEFALPVLKHLNVPASFFVTTAHLRQGAAAERKMSARQLRELLDEGMEIGSHSRNHPNLRKLSEREARSEILGSKLDLESLLGRSVDLFAYPGGEFNQGVVRMVREAGYAAACSVISPAANDRSSLFWMYRNSFNESLHSLGDYYRLSPVLTKLLEFRVRRRLSRALTVGGY